MKQRAIDFRNSQFLKNDREYQKIKRKLKKHPKLFQLGCEIETEVYREKVNKRYTKKIRKKYKKLWMNTISLNE
jgi:hypothetical protein